MSVYKPKATPHYVYDFQVGGRRFCGTTGCSTKKDAERVEQQERDAAKAKIKARGIAAAGPLTIKDACDRYWGEVGQHHSGAATTLRNLVRLEGYFGPAKRLDEITDDDVAKLVAWRRQQTVRGRTRVLDPKNPKRKISAPRIADGTVNRSTTEVLQKIFNRAINVWKRSFPDQPKWALHLLDEEQERVREVRGNEEQKLDAVRTDYRPLVNFARASGLRQAECLMKKESVDFGTGRIRVRGKGGKIIVIPITDEMREILIRETDNPTEHVFTYVAARAKMGKKGYPKGARLPITKSGLKTQWRRAKHRKTGESLPADLKFHDLRHDFATKLLRETGNLKLVQKALNHSKIETTLRYAHVLDEEVLAGMEAASKARKKGNSAP